MIEIFCDICKRKVSREKSVNINFSAIFKHTVADKQVCPECFAGLIKIFKGEKKENDRK